MTVFSAIVSCTLAMPEICDSRFPTLEHELDEAVVALVDPGARDRWQPFQPWAPGARRPASVPAASTSLDRRYWQDWAVARLKETEHYLDVAAYDPGLRSARDALNRAATELVAFHGYAGSGRTDRMLSTLQQIEESSRQAQNAACVKR